MKKILITSLLFINAFQKILRMILHVQACCCRVKWSSTYIVFKKAFSHEKLEIHDIIVERFEKPYEKTLGRIQKYLSKNQEWLLVPNFMKRIRR